MKFVQFTDDTKTTIRAAFLSKQCDKEYPNQGQVEDDDPRFLAFTEPLLGATATVTRKRNELLAASDWTVLQDSPLTTAQKSQWKTYRQALRDVTSQPGYPAQVEWPAMPS